MLLRLEDIKAEGQAIVIKGVERKLRPYDIEVQLRCDKMFETKEGMGGGLTVLHLRLQNADLGAFIRVCYCMLEDQTAFKDFDDFISQLTSSSIPAELIQMLVVKALKDGQPVLETDVKKKMLWTLGALGWIIAACSICWHLAIHS